MFSPIVIPKECLDPKDPTKASPIAMESQACCDALAKNKTPCSDAKSIKELKSILDKDLNQVKNDYATLVATVCASNKACNASFTHDADFRNSICESECKTKNKPWEIATWVLAGVLALFLLVALMRLRSGSIH
jgi:hypothetical protein